MNINAAPAPTTVICGQTLAETVRNGCPVAGCAVHARPADGAACTECGATDNSSTCEFGISPTGMHTFPAPAGAVVPSEPKPDPRPTPETAPVVHTATVSRSNTDAVIGTVTFAERSEPRTEHHTYYAADTRTYAVLPGTYAVRLVRKGSFSAASVLITVDIEVTDESLHSGFGGVNFATDRNTEVRRDTKTFNLYDYQVAAAASDFRPALVGGAFQLDPAWCVLTRHETFEDGRHHTSNKLARLS